MSKKTHKKSKAKKIFLIINYILSITLLLMIFILNILPFKYLILVIIGIILINVILTFLLIKRKKIGYIFSTIFILISGFIGYYLATTYNFLSYLNKDNYKTETFLVVVLKDSNYDKLDDLKGKDIGYVKNEITSINKALDKVNKKIDIENIEYDNYNLVFEDIISKDLTSSLIEESNYNMILEENPSYNDLFKVIDKIEIITKIDNKNGNVNVTKDTFNILISGIDNSGDISSVGRSDVNIVLTINPKTKQILMTSIPRDYYVQLHNTTGYKDKLTHAGIYGIDMSILTIEDLLDIDINYYFRVNFTTLEQVVDALGGVDVYSEYSFVSYIGSYQFYKGYNHMNGNQALGFARERKTLPEGDISRAKNQQAVIDGIVRKLTEFSSITKYTSLLNSLKNSFQTNMTNNDVTSLIKMQLNDNANWNITSNVLSGEGASEYTYSYKGQKLYVMIPDTDSVNEAGNLIDDVTSGKLLDSSYTEEVSDVKNPNKVYTNNNNNNSNNNSNNTSNNNKPKEEIKEEENTTDNTNNDGNNNNDEEEIVPPSDNDDDSLTEDDSNTNNGDNTNQPTGDGEDSNLEDNTTTGNQEDNTNSNQNNNNNQSVTN